MVSLDTFVMLLALPHLSAALHATSTQQLWIMDVYGFMVGGLLITAGTLGDRVGRRRLLLIGAGMFGVASVVAAYSTGPAMLIAARAVLGVAGATLTPSTLALITTMFRDPRQRASAVGVWAGCFTVGAIVGPLVGGAMLDHFWWGSVLLLGAPAMALLLVLGPALLPEYRNPDSGRLDLASVVLSLAAILPFIYGLKEIARHGWRPVAVAALVAGAAAGVAFAHRQQGQAEPLLDLRLFARRGFTITLTGILLYTMLSGGTMVFVAQYFQLVNGLTPLQSGLALVPGMALGVASFQISPLLARRIRPAHLFASGLAITAAGMLTFTQATAGGTPAAAIAGFCLASLGGGPLVSLGINLVVGSAPPERAGSAAGVAQTASECGYALGIALLGSLGALVYRTQIHYHLPVGTPRRLAAVLDDSLAGALHATRSLPGPLATAVSTAARLAFTSGLHAVSLATAAVLTGTAVLIATGLRHLPPLRGGGSE
jgi:DHA2 family multidrug resistance protein-like MFS transporter